MSMVISDKTVDKKDYFRKIALFSELGTEELRLITSISRIIRLRKNSVIFHCGDPYTGFYILLKGSIKIFKINPEGKETILHLIRPFNIFADVPLFEGKVYPVNAQCLEESVLMFIPGEEFIALLKNNAGICLKMLAGFAKKMRYLTHKVEELSGKEVTARLAEFLLEELEKGKDCGISHNLIRLSVSKSTIASYLGTITETLSRSFRKLRDEGIIRIEGKKIFVLDTARLRKTASL